METSPDDRCALQNLATATQRSDNTNRTDLVGSSSSSSQSTPQLALPTITTKISQLLTDLSVASPSPRIGVSVPESSYDRDGIVPNVNISALFPLNSFVTINFSSVPGTVPATTADDQNRTDGRFAIGVPFGCGERNFADLANAFGGGSGHLAGGSGPDFGPKLEVSKTTDDGGPHLLIANWQDCVIVVLFCLLIVVTVIGNTLVILSVITTRRLRTVTNCFVMSLAVADWLVGIFVMPPAVAVHLLGSWPLGWILCDIWISLDVLLCTASILSLCAISIDRYLAVTQPLNYSRRRRSKRLALLMILVVWVLALAITCPPILGWYEPGRRELDQCRYNQNEGYVVFSAMGSFFIPMAVMIYVYVRISCVVASRHDKMTEIEVHKKSHRTRDTDEECYHFASEIDPAQLSPKRKRSSSQLSTATTTYVTQQGGGSCSNAAASGGDDCSMPLKKNHKNGHYELVDINSTAKTAICPVGSAVGGGGGGAGADADGSQCSQHSPALKRNSSMHYKLASSTELWSSANNVFNQQPKPQTANHPGGLRRTNTISNSIMATTTSVTTGRNMRIHQKSLSSRILSMKRENKTTQTLSIVVGGFIACWLPFFIHYLLTPFLPKELAAPKLGEFFTWLGWINSAINPFIYAFYSVDFRAAFWRLTLRRFFRNSEKAPFSNIHNMSMRR
ncbi:probable G-protein coupled receptor No18 [Topomyia yanbarensis]|uniref:probable G-protein coupled receptor No18 n=1 Tax=Topomyia yanbarensis TaxID=2498891 RepID=UPI00273CB132|nr:probable G-protein coupled receptor No18 [Topomyia yanbarensis]XP_058812594.1 probable G-protein coupled receptor No18 [Topomyia yanbarensis]XP_058812595.1 probable G-protein coupled receptor No18 [Topomyia yanbarensis]XP_058812596.1 probable G-protein coupled receptor No18 [Topomyia yanbarensis]XP_058812597.1 probable G-protein coupled receptor No18 [Topomyia yanbarensis]XP_058812598.1 probable G-protein coupled receptor No18 [Topomyia yanbarensis]